MDLTQLSSNLKVKTDFNAGSTFGLRDINSVVGVVDNSVTSLQALIFSNKEPKFDDMNITNFDETGIQSGYDNVCFVFDIKKEYKYNLGSDITDHYVEDNVAIQDHVGLKPIILEVTGCIGEVNLKDTKIDRTQKEKKKENIFNTIDSYLGRMGSLTSFAPNIVNQAMDIYNTAKFGYATVNKLINFNKDEDSTNSKYDYTEKYTEKEISESKQFKWLDWFTTQWKQRASFTIVTPYGILKNMYIVELVASQPESTRYVTNLSIKFKQIRKAIVIKKGTKQTAQTMDTQKRSRTYREEMNYERIEYKEGDDIKAKENPAMVTQENLQEFEEYKSMIQSFNVPKPQGWVAPPAFMVNSNMMGF